MTSLHEPPRFECAAGTVMGWRDSDLVRATGIRYARAERFQSPSAQPLAAEPIPATDWAPACSQARKPITEVAWGAHHLGEAGYDEHSQRLSVTMPADSFAGENLPVMVGSSNTMISSPSRC